MARLDASGGRPGIARHAALAVRLGLDQAGVHGEALAADQAFRHAPAQDHVEQLTQQVALPKTAVAVLGEGRVIRHGAFQTQPAEPAIGQVEVDLFAQPTLRPNAEAVADQQHPDQQFGIDRGATDGAVERRQMRSQALKLHEPVDRPQQMVRRDMVLQRESIEQGRLIDPPLAHHHAASGLNDQSESAPEARGNCRLFQRYRWEADIVPTFNQ